MQWSLRMALLSGVVFAALCGPAKADWFSDLTDRIQTNSPAAWEGQKRGYYTGGGFGLRLKTSREPLLNIQPPRISAGCGGIDAFWGGFNYLRPEYLVQAFQNIMSAAPAYAFKLALQQLCDPCDDVMSALQQISQAANNLALDECGSAQALVNMGGDAISSMLGMDANQGTSEFGIWVSDKANKLTSGVAKFNDEVRKLQNYAFCGGFSNHEDYDRCSIFVDISGSLWDKARKVDRTAQNLPDESFFQMARALFGEMIVTPSEPGDGEDKATTMYGVDYYDPCPTTTVKTVVANMLGNLTATATSKSAQNQDATLPDGASSGAIVPTPPSGTVDASSELSRIAFRDVIRRDDTAIGVTECQVREMPDSLKVYQRAQNAIETIADAMQNNPQTTLDNSVIDVVLQSRLPVYQIINSLAYRGFYGGALTHEEKAALIKLTSIGYVQFLLEEFVMRAEGILDQAYIQLSTSKKAAPVDPQSLEAGYQAIKKRMASFRRELMESFQDVHQTYMTAFKENLQFQQMRDYYQSLLKNRGIQSVFSGL